MTISVSQGSTEWVVPAVSSVSLTVLLRCFVHLDEGRDNLHLNPEVQHYSFFNIFKNKTYFLTCAGKKTTLWGGGGVSGEGHWPCDHFYCLSCSHLPTPLLYHKKGCFSDPWWLFVYAYPWWPGQFHRCKIEGKYEDLTSWFVWFCWTFWVKSIISNLCPRSLEAAAAYRKRHYGTLEVGLNGLYNLRWAMSLCGRQRVESCSLNEKWHHSLCIWTLGPHFGRGLRRRGEIAKVN